LNKTCVKAWVIVQLSGPLGVDRRRFAASTPATAMWAVTSGGHLMKF